MRVYQGDSIDNNPRPHTFVEIERDSFIEIRFPKCSSLSDSDKQRLRAYTRKVRAEERKTRTFHIRSDYRYFASICKVPNLTLLGEF